MRATLTYTTGAERPLTARPIAPGEEREFFRLYRRHPGVSRWFVGSRRVLLGAAAAGPASGQAFLLARDGERPVGALALQRQAGRRALCFYPVVDPDARDRRAVLAALGDAARAAARGWGARLLEAEVVPDPRHAALEKGLAGAGLVRITERLLLSRRTSDVARDVPALLPCPDEDAHAVLAEIYASSGDPAVKAADARDDLALMREEHRGLAVSAWIAGGSLGGICIGEVVRRQGTILFLGLLPSRQGRGLGRQLLAGSLAMLAGQGARQVRLAVSCENRPALQLYRAGGFSTIGRTRLYRAPVDDPGSGRP